MQSKTEKLKKIATQLHKLFPGGMVTLQVNVHEGNVTGLELSYFGTRTYVEATEWMRDLGIGKREKAVYNTYTALTGEVDGIKVRTYPDDMPPTCRLETYTEKIPVTQTVNTGEFVEVQRTRVVCDGKAE